MSATHYLVDKSALWRLDLDTVADVLEPRINRGLVGVSIVTELEIGYSAQSHAGYQLMQQRVIRRLVPVLMPPRAEDRARDVQAQLVRRGHHRAAGVADLLLAATAEMDRRTMLHYDADFDLIAEVTGQPMEWVVPRGSI